MKRGRGPRRVVAGVELGVSSRAPVALSSGQSLNRVVGEVCCEQMRLGGGSSRFARFAFMAIWLCYLPLHLAQEDMRTWPGGGACVSTPPGGPPSVHAFFAGCSVAACLNDLFSSETSCFINRLSKTTKPPSRGAADPGKPCKSMPNGAVHDCVMATERRALQRGQGTKTPVAFVDAAALRVRPGFMGKCLDEQRGSRGVSEG